MLTRAQDAYGRLIYDLHRGSDTTEIVERDDGWIAESGGARDYFAPCARWPKLHRLAMRAVRGRVLDIGAGAGRVSLHLQTRGHEVLAIDLSPLAIRTVRLRGVRHARVLSITQISRRAGTFDTLVELRGILRGTRWRIQRIIDSPGPTYIAVLCKAQA